MKAYISEFIGTFVLVLFGCGSMVAANFLGLYASAGNNNYDICSSIRYHHGDDVLYI